MPDLIIVELQGISIERKRFIICYLSSIFLFRYVVFLLLFRLQRYELFFERYYFVRDYYNAIAYVRTFISKKGNVNKYQKMDMPTITFRVQHFFSN